jgi:NADH-quinone oxidoreductase subunit K
MSACAAAAVIAVPAVTPEAMVLVTSALLFALGVVGLLLRRSPIAVLMAVELLLNAGNLLLLLSARAHARPDGVSAALLVLVLGAAEAVVGLALALAFFRSRPDADVDTPGEVQG